MFKCLVLDHVWVGWSWGRKVTSINSAPAAAVLFKFLRIDRSIRKSPPRHGLYFVPPGSFTSHLLRVSRRKTLGVRVGNISLSCDNVFFSLSFALAVRNGLVGSGGSKVVRFVSDTNYDKNTMNTYQGS